MLKSKEMSQTENLEARNGPHIRVPHKIVERVEKTKDFFKNKPYITETHVENLKEYKFHSAAVSSEYS